MKTPRPFSAALLAAFPAVLFAALPAQAQTRPHLCRAGEIPVFACSTGARIVSLCASADLSENGGALTYRYGTRRQIELTYPQPGVSPQQAFKGGVTGYSGGGADYIRFAVGDTAYTLFSDYYRGRESDGVTVERGEKLLATLKCRGPAVDPGEGWSRIYKARLPRYEGGFDTPRAR